MRRLSVPLFVMLVIASGAFIAGTVGTLPERVATHFAAGGRANGWMSREGYLWFTLALATLLPIAVASMFATMTRVAPRSLKIPNRDYWLADARRADTNATLSRYGCALGCMLTVFFAAVHYSILEANASAPAQLPTSLFEGTFVAFFVALALWTGAFYMRFRRSG